MMTSVLTRIFGASRIDLVEDVVQEALLRALEVWPYRGVPSNPTAWLLQVAKNRALDHVRRDASFAAKVEAGLLSLDPDAAASDVLMPGPLGDDVLAMLFMCCHPSIPKESRVALALKSIAGLSAAEIARGLVVSETAVMQRIVRAKNVIAEDSVDMAMPAGSELRRRREAVHETLYLWFNEGYLAHEGPDLVRADLCHEALRLARLIALHPSTESPEGHALAALMALLAARLPARMNEEGDLLLLREQDRRRWDHVLLGIGFLHLKQSAQGDTLTAYHLEAGIAACHASAPSYAATDWTEIIRGYERLGEIKPSPVITLNRAIAQSRLFGPAVAIATLLPLAGDARMSGHRLLPATLAELYLESGDLTSASRWFVAALRHPWPAPSRRFLEERLQDAGVPIAH